MKHIFLSIIALFAAITAANSQNNTTAPQTTGGWEKYEYNPVLGGHLGMVFDLSVMKNDKGIYRMYCSVREQESVGFSESKDGINWSVPKICLLPIQNSDWEKRVNRICVIEKDGLYHLWYTSMIDLPDEPFHGRSWIGYATSKDGENWKRMSDKPIISPELPWEDVAVMCPHVIWDEQEKIFKMWYSAGEMWEPDAVGYATSKDGLHWEKYKNNPVFVKDKNAEWERAKVTACQVIKRKNDYLMFYIGFSDGSHAQIGMARSKDGISNWERFKDNPIVRPGQGWDNESVYKPFAVPDEANNRWILYYNARRDWNEQIGAVIHEGMELEF
jgi:predicted GH43/DUF377 family glycosyl hydrolase